VRTGDSRLLDLIGDASELLEIEEFRLGLLQALKRAVPSDWVSLNDIGPDPESISVIMDPPAEPELVEEFSRLAHQNPLIEHYNATHDGRALRISDVVSQEEFHSREIYQRVYQVLGVEYQIAFTLPHVRDRILGVVLSRSERDFDDDERDVLEAARPFLIQAYRNAVRYSALLAGQRAGHPSTLALPGIARLRQLGLTRRQSEVLQLIATGAAEREIGSRLGISHRTVQKHLEHCYRALGVDSRSQAAAIAWATIDIDAEAED
jgi:DNA-binding CsgD family transcriptional regulator